MLSNQRMSLDQEVFQHIDAVAKKYQQEVIVNEYEYSVNFDLQTEKVKLKSFLDSSFMQENITFWGEAVGVHFIEDTSSHTKSELPQDKVCIYTKHDEDKLPISISIYYLKHWSEPVEINLIKIGERTQEVRKNKLSYLGNLDATFTEIELVISQCKNKSKQECDIAINAFNQKWANQLTMILKRDSCYVVDTLGNHVYSSATLGINYSISLPHIHSKPTFEKPATIPQLRTYSSQSFWQRNRHTGLKAALAIGVAGIVWASLCK